MKFLSLRRVLAVGLLLVVLGAGLALWLVGSSFGRRHLTQLVRERLGHNSDLVLAPFEVEISPWRDFPHLTASLRHLSLTDTSYQQPVQVLRVERADMRLELSSLLRGKIRGTRLVISDVDFRERVDSLGHSWGLHGKRKSRTGSSPTLDFKMDSLIVNNFRLTTRNDYAHSSFGASVRKARLTAHLLQGVLHAGGTLDGQLDYLRNSSGAIFEREPVKAWVNYQFNFPKREGSFRRTRATLNGDTVHISGTHTATANQRAGTLMNLQFEGMQPLMEVLHIALPTNLLPYLEGATSPSKAHIRYTISGQNGPTVTTHNVLSFGLRNASLRWPDSTRRISRWDLAGTYDNGPEHNTKTTSLALQHCRIYSSAGQLDIALTVSNFDNPFVSGRLRGRAELPELAAVVSPGLWRARSGIADLDVQLHGLLPPTPGRRTPVPTTGRMSVRGGVNLRNASFVLLDRGADMSELNVRVGLQDSIWNLSNASGVLDKMRFRATATTVNLLDYLTGQYPTTMVTGNFAVDELRVARLRELLRPMPRSTPKPAATRAVARKRTSATPASRASNFGSSLFPPGMRLNVALRCNRLVLPYDTLHQLAVTVRHDGKRVQLRNLAGRVWGGQVRGQASWPTDTIHQVSPIEFQLGVRFEAINYRNLLAKMARPAQRSGKTPSSPALRDLLLAANGHVTCDVNTLLLPVGENLRHLRFRLTKTGSRLHMPSLDFATTRGGTGHASASVRVAGSHLAAADASLDLRYAMLDVQQLLQLLASLSPEEDQRTPDVRQAERVAKRARPDTPDNSLLTSDILTAVVRVQADRVRYSAVTGSNFRLVSHLLDGEARLDECSVNAFQGRIRLRGRLLTHEGQQHHPLHVQTELQDIQLPELFAALKTMGLNVLGGDNVRGSMRCAADFHTDLDGTFLPVFSETLAYLKADVRDLELLNVEALMEALKFMKEERTSHLFFEPVSTQFVLNRGQLMIPSLRLNSNLSNLEISGNYFLDGRTDLYVGLNPLQALFGDNKKRIERIQSGQLVRSSRGRPTYVNLHRSAAGSKYKVRLFKKEEQRQQQATLRQQSRDLLLSQQLDTTLRLLR
ncbi:AsmA-like C-terminal region-containing protein [Hymenobacter sp. BT491]|uniref:AsmA-like C-terminal region-containing protein n=1 Tax=Hymenobacter sp. BT491 TaxID=2766779 RepID=UPI001653619B|nr:AsmA-like C-terminal region-containing protein [Hymenobacter sp. BT491]MBC6989422.1 hypothetical protein [Hymenobacter sp. BT491]